MADEKTVAVHENQINQLRKETDEQWDGINKLREKFDLLMRKWVPAWITLTLTVMGTVTGSALTVAIMIIKFANSK